jgi:hypothetical protein
MTKSTGNKLQVFLHIFTATAAAASGILACNDVITPIAAVNPMVAHYWPIILAGSAVVDRVCLAVIKSLTQTNP